jgi:hypothetical protein
MSILKKLRKEHKRFAQDNSAQSNLVQLFLGIAIAFIVGVGVAVPILNDVIADTNFSNSMTETVVGYVPLFLGLLLLVAVAAPIMRRV